MTSVRATKSRENHSGLALHEWKTFTLNQIFKHQKSVQFDLSGHIMDKMKCHMYYM